VRLPRVTLVVPSWNVRAHLAECQARPAPILRQVASFLVS
jgi:hypothetical protein